MQYEGCSRNWKTAKKRCVSLAFEHGHGYVTDHPMYPGSWVLFSSSDANEKPPDTARYERHCTLQIETAEEPT